MEIKKREREKMKNAHKKQKQFPNEASKLHAKNIRQILLRERDR